MSLAVYGRRVATPLYLAFGVLGLALATGHLSFWLRAPVTRREWFYAPRVTAFPFASKHGDGDESCRESSGPVDS